MFNKTINFLKNVNLPLSKESINVLYTAHNIRYEKCELYNDFIQSLMMLIFETYMGDEITDKEQQINHYNWCWNKTISNFKQEGILIDSNKLHKYFLDFMMDVYYSTTQKNDNQILQNNILRLWSYIFNYSAFKTKVDMDTMIELYTIFENSLSSAE